MIYYLLAAMGGADAHCRLPKNANLTEKHSQGRGGVLCWTSGTGGQPMYDELVKRLRQCAEASCAGCKNDLVEIGCRGKLQIEAADAIEERCQQVDKFAEEAAEEG